MDEKQGKNIDKLFSLLFFKGKGKEYIEFTNSVGQRFFIPIGHIRTGIALYHASRIKGKLVKMLLPFIRNSSTLLAKVCAQKMTLQETSALHDLLTKIFNRNDLTLAISCGTPGIHRKITVQISSRDEVLGYAKISGEPDVKSLFENEIDILKELRTLGINAIPQSLFYGELSSCVNIFIQDTVKKDRPVNKLRNEPLVWDFLLELYVKTSGEIPFKQTGYYQDLQRLKDNQLKHNLKESALLQCTMAEVNDFFQNNATRFSVFHGDFTLWNTFIHQNKLYVFDWEYSRPAYPPFLDFFHFFTQCAFYEWRWDAMKTIRKFNSKQSVIKKYISLPDLWYKAYLLAIIGFYIDRDKGKTNELYQFRINLLKVLNKDISKRK
ncbi:MAG: phosphotransferase [Tannerella sp.]|jgi:hypothetical protein|nr:phosphotransferase [Tannerella sp.]